MSTLSREHRRLLENTVAEARTIAEEGARKVLADQYAVHHHEPWPHMNAEDRALRNQLRAHGRQLGDRRDPRRETQEISHLVQACGYEHWHRMLFARFLAENDLLLDAENGVAMTLDEVRELAREEGRDWLDVAAKLAQRMLLRVFRPDDPVLKVQLPPETRQQLERKLAALPKHIFQADDSLGWVYQFWQSEEKRRVNDSGVKIGADELPAVTELFTEDYMVWFLLHNTLGAWWTAKRKAEGKDPNLQGYEWTYLRLKEDGAPAAGKFDGWPRAAKDIKVLDPSMGSGHFLVFVLPILVGFRMEEEGLSREQAVEAVLRDNLFGLEIDPRCTQIAAFNLAWSAWRMIGYRALPQLNLASSGLGINAKEEDWVKLAGRDDRARETMRRLYHLFQQAPVIGSLIDPKRVGGTLFTAEFEKVSPFLERALTLEDAEEDIGELAITAKGLVEATRILANTFNLVATNVPYLGRRRQHDILRDYSEQHYPDAKADLATCFLERCIGFCGKQQTVALVSPQSWRFLGTYKRFRERFLKSYQWNAVAKLGPGAFETITGEIVNVALVIMTRQAPSPGHEFCGLDVEDTAGAAEKASRMRSEPVVLVGQEDQLRNPDARVVVGHSSGFPLLSAFAEAVQGTTTGDNPRYIAQFWEITSPSSDWEFFQDNVEETEIFGGRELMIHWERGRSELATSPEARVQGQSVFGRRGVFVAQMGKLPATLYTGEFFSMNGAALVPRNMDDWPAIWTYCSSATYARDVRKLDKAIKVTNASLAKVPFDVSTWRRAAAENYPSGLPQPSSCEPTQWLFNGHPREAGQPLQVAVARLVGYHWPRQSGCTFIGCSALGHDDIEKHADADGVVPLNALAGKTPAADRLRASLADAYGSQWSAAKLRELLGESGSLEDWLRDGFFEEHCRIFHQRPFVWHIWDGRKDGFQALVNYHRLAAPNGEGRKTLEKLIYTYLGRWIERQNEEVKAGKEGADARLTAATHLKAELERILKGEKPHDIFIRWKTLHEQPIGWEPDINDGVRLNIRPWLTAKPYQPSRRDACILRVTPRINYGKDRGEEPRRPKEEFPWFWSWDERSDDFLGGKDFDGARWNDLHYSINTKKQARELKQTAEVKR